MNTKNHTQTIKVLKYVQKSFEYKPSFLIELDGIEYISNGCVFAENTDKNIESLIKKFECEEYLIELFNSDISGFENVTDARCMFYGCELLTSFNADMSNVTDARFMFRGCESLTSFNADMSNVLHASSMFYGCELLNR